MNSPFNLQEDPLQTLLANAFAQQQAQEFLSRPPAEARWPNSELLTPVHQSDKGAAGEMCSADSFLQQLQQFLDQAEPESRAIEPEPSAPARQNAGCWLEETTSTAASCATPAPGDGGSVCESEVQGATIQQPASVSESSFAPPDEPADAIHAAEFLRRRRLEAQEEAVEVSAPRKPAPPQKSRFASGAGWRYAVLAILAGCVLGLGVARQEGKPGALRPAAAISPGTTPSEANSPALLASPAPQRASGPVLISDITSSAVSGAAQVSIDLQGPVQYRAYRLHNPERLYFDLQNADLAPPLLGRSVALNEGLIRKIRSAQHGPDVSRVTLETEGRCKYQASILPDPYRLIIELQQRPSARK